MIDFKTVVPNVFWYITTYVEFAYQITKKKNGIISITEIEISLYKYSVFLYTIAVFFEKI